MSTQRESSTPARYLPLPVENVTDDLARNAARWPDQPAFARRTADAWRTVTWSRFADEVRRLAAGLVEAGIRSGDRVAIMSGTSYEWVRADFAIWSAGAVTVPIYETSSVAQVAWILRNSGAVAVFVADDHRRSLVEQAGQASVRHVWPMADLDTLAASAGGPAEAEVDRRRLEVTADDLATIVYTSGTTGLPKGCRLSHGNLLAAVHAVTLADGIGDDVLTPDASMLLFLPLAHILTRVVQLAAIHNGTLTAHTSDVANVGAELASFRPTLLLAVPRIFEKFRERAARSAAADGRRRLFQAAERVAVAYGRALDTGRPGMWLRVQRRLFDLLVYPKLRAALGGNVTYAASGGAPLSAELGYFLRGIGITVLEGYGLTETAAGVTFNLPASLRIGTVGRPLPGCQVRIADDGEVLVKSAAVFGGYWDDERATKEAFDESGWFRTGDLGRLDDGYLTITGRKNDLIVTATGKNVAAAAIEDRVRSHTLIDHCVVVGDNRPYLIALVTIDQDALTDWKAEHGKPAGAGTADLVADADLLQTVETIVDTVNHEVSAPESIRRFRIMPGEFLVSEELTPTQKVRRGYVVATYAAEIDAMYRA